jgi:hypothetical protein
MMRNVRLSWVAILLSLAACNRETVCPSDQRLCDGTCVAVATDAKSCGACGHACAAGEQCSAGLCRCPDGRADCDGSCVDVRSDPSNCGACGTVCGAGTFCTTAAGGATSCAEACATAEQTACGQACVDLGADTLSCGACGRACGTNERCDAGGCVAYLYVACFNSGDVREATLDLEPAGTPIAVAAGPMNLARLGTSLFVASSAFGGIETISELRFDPPAPRAAPVLVTSVPAPDLEYLTEHGGLLWAAHTSVSTLLVVKADGTIVDELRLVPQDAPSGNVQGIAFAGDKAYVALNARDEVAVVDVSGVAACAAGTASPPCMSLAKRIDVKPLASAGALAGPARLLAVGGRVYVTLVNLDASFGVPEGSTGRLAVLDTATDGLDASVTSGGVKGLVDLGAACLNAGSLAVQGSTLFVTCGAFGGAGIVGAGVAPVDLSGATPVAKPVLPAAQDAALGALAFCGGAGYVGDRNSGRVFRLDPVAGALSGVELCPVTNGFAFVSDLACGP